MPRFGYDFELINPKVPPLLLLRDELFARLSSWYRKPIRRS